tara:strand:+ start:1632 stop:1946 length:315 start_codon:yes stop_codon:yes gene_type:complete
MKVKVSYTMEYDDVPNLVSELFEDCTRRLREHGKQPFNNNSLERFVQGVKKIQEDLSLIHDQLEDCVSLTSGFEAHKSRPSAPEEMKEPDIVFPSNEELLDESD